MLHVSCYATSDTETLSKLSDTRIERFGQFGLTYDIKMKNLYLFLGIVFLSTDALGECLCNEEASRIQADDEITLIGTAIKGDEKFPGWVHHGFLIRIDERKHVPKQTDVAIDVLKEERLCKELEHYFAGDYLKKECTQEKAGVGRYMCPDDSASPSKLKYQANCSNTIESRVFNQDEIVIDSSVIDAACAIKFEKGKQYFIRARRYRGLGGLGTGLALGDIAERWSTNVCYGTKIIS